MEVRFRVHVFRPPYTPYYDAYKGHTFKIVSFHYRRSHATVVCVSDPSMKVAGQVHPEDLKRVRRK